MKKYFYLPILALGMLAFNACGDDDPTEDVENNGGNNGNSNTNTTDKSGDGTGSISANALAPSAQQERLQSIGKEALSYFSALDFTYYKDLAEYADDKYFDNDDFSNDVVEDYFEDMIESTKLGSTQEKETYSYWTYIYTYNDVKKLIMLSNLKARFTAGSRKWSREDADHLEFVFTDHNGSQCVASVKSSGASKTVHVMDDNSWGSYYYDYENNTSYDECDREKYYISIPENINVTFTVSGTERVTVSTKINLNGIQNETFDLDKSSVDATVTAKVDAYTFKTTNTKYTPNSTVQTTFSMSKNGKTILSGECKVGDFKLTGVSGDAMDEDVWDDMEDDFDISGGKGSFRLNLLGKMQINGVLSNVQTLIDDARDADKYDEDEQKFKKAVERMNNVISVGVYYDGKNEKQAEFSLKAFEHKGWSYTYWEYQPVLSFADGSSYSLTEENSFFNEKSFKSLIDQFEDLVDDFEDLFD